MSDSSKPSSHSEAHPETHPKTQTNTASETDLFELVGGLEGLTTLLSDFYERVFRDPMIGYLFMGQDKARLVQREVEWTAKRFGATLAYEGRPLREAHARHPIRRGHFHRRNQLLKDVLRDHHTHPLVVEAWVSHSEALEAAILGRAAGDTRCERTSDEP